LDNQSRNRLLKLARQTIAASLEGRPRQALSQADRDLGQDQGAFVTLHQRGRLRGCIGLFEGQGSLAETVQEMALSAAFQDPRFRPLGSLGELQECDIEISVLSPLRETDPEAIEVGQHGIYIIRGPYRGVLLPQVATENGWDRETFLDHTCLKAGLNPGCWRQPGTRILTFSAEVFGEAEPPPARD